jgi:hypothetical protein
MEGRLQVTRVVVSFVASLAGVKRLGMLLPNGRLSGG